jgi:2',3'-cyclic-nucleotide 2'-phosphodiesterase (5'-nucleotidase family)
MAERLRFSTILIVGCASAITLVSTYAAAQHQRLTLLHTSDLHGSVLPWDDFQNQPADGSLAQVSTLVTQIRNEVEHPVLVFDSGDTIQGTPFEQFSHVRWSEPSPTIAAMNHIGYDAMAVGNHEFNFGLDVLRRAESQAEFPFLSANTINETDALPAFPTHMVIELGELRVGVIGLVTPNIPGWERPEHYRGLVFEPMDVVARDQIRLLRETEGCDLVILLAHTGFEKDPDDGSPSGTEVEDFASRLAQIPGVDLLLTGHTHKDIPPRELGGAIVSQPRARARLLTRIDLELELEQKNGTWRIASWEGRNLPLKTVAPDPAIQESMANLHQRVVTALEGPVGRVSDMVSVAGCRLNDCAALDLIHQVQLEASGADISLASLLTDRTPDLPAGPVTWRWIYSFYVYPNTLVKVAVTGAEIRDILEHAARYYNGLECDPINGCTLLTDPSVPHYNVDTMAGVSYRVDPTQAVGHRVRDLRIRGRAMDLHQIFTLVCNNYRAAGGGGYPHLAEADPVWRSSDEMTDLIGDFIEQSGSWQPGFDNNWWIGPALTAERAQAATP